MPAAPAKALGERRALITGSTAGLGQAIAAGLAEAGCSVMLHGLETAETVEPQREALARRTGVQVAYHKADLSTAAGVQSLVAAAGAELGGVDILINNAVVRHFASIIDFPPEQWDLALAVNLSAIFHAVRLVLPQMRARNFGRIFNITSVYGMRGTPGRVGYVTTKSAILGFTRAVALENLDVDVTCHSLCPGSVLTPGTESRVEELMADRGIDRGAAERLFLEGKQPGGTFVSPQSVSDLLVFLCGPIARDMTGAMLPVEGGWLAS
ncbi:SDR family NAD(P)-dependent oxidoreductase [Mesorhizobium sp. ES1-1]|uniref:SDR family NAD(P)-dependent oxidoreductase n=1 Tax=Mesorhizobium sp. ES1-1 TaxID=2876629 RepID=UPI001CCD1C87|nr:SDR family NAD(P)-dependent oxidoreductase [Mesorhizobium sp. ES1-1]MBZ9674281.1 SDR family NAD(P)-dependent oxidoreductase [Mesorhizobium sp. ES1-1]